MNVNCLKYQSIIGDHLAVLDNLQAQNEVEVCQLQRQEAHKQKEVLVHDKKNLLLAHIVQGRQVRRVVLLLQ